MQKYNNMPSAGNTGRWHIYFYILSVSFYKYIGKNLYCGYTSLAVLIFIPGPIVLASVTLL